MEIQNKKVKALQDRLEQLIHETYSEESVQELSKHDEPAKCSCHFYQAYLFSQSQNEVLQEDLLKQQRIAWNYKDQYTKVKNELDGLHWIITEKDTEIRILQKDKDYLNEKLIDQKLEYL